MKNLTDKQIIKINQGIACSNNELSSLNSEILNDTLDEIYSDNSVDIYEKCAQLLELFENRKPFTKFNIRTAIVSIIETLKMNEIIVICSNRSINDLVEKVSDGEYQHEDLLNWILSHCISKKYGKQKVYAK